MDDKLIKIRTKEGLPLVTKETVTAFSKSLEKEVVIREYFGMKKSILGEWTNEIREENPEVIAYILELTERFCPEAKGAILASILSVYELLKSQALNDKIKEYFGIRN